MSNFTHECTKCHELVTKEESTGPCPDCKRTGMFVPFVKPMYTQGEWDLAFGTDLG